MFHHHGSLLALLTHHMKDIMLIFDGLGFLASLVPTCYKHGKMKLMMCFFLFTLALHIFAAVVAPPLPPLLMSGATV
jgi:hypothetical protein